MFAASMKPLCGSVSFAIGIAGLLVGCFTEIQGAPLAIGAGISCEDDWQLFCASTDTDDCHCYGLFDERKLWDDARFHCVEHGADLASVHSAAENNFLAGLKSSAEIEEAWLGYRRVYGLRAAFQWSDGTPSTFEKWDYAEPNNSGGHEDCASQWKAKETWNDRFCHSYRLPFFCKRHHSTVPLALGAKLLPNQLLMGLEAPGDQEQLVTPEYLEYLEYMDLVKEKLGLPDHKEQLRLADHVNFLDGFANEDRSSEEVEEEDISEWRLESDSGGNENMESTGETAICGPECEAMRVYEDFYNNN